MGGRDELGVWLHGRRIGTLGRAPGGEATFSYTDDVVERFPVGAALLSASLPVRPADHAGPPVDTWLSGCVPADDDEPLEALATLGHDGRGAAVVSCELLDDLDPADLDPLDDGSFAAAVQDARAGRTALPGRRRKLRVVKRDDGSLALPRVGAPVVTSHVLKPDVSGAVRSAAAEAFTQTLAAAAGLSAVETLYREWGGLPVVVSARADRQRGTAGWQRVHHESAAQAIGPREGPPRLADVAVMLRRRAATPQPALATLLRQVTFLAAVGDARLHPEHLLVRLDEPVGPGPLVAARATTTDDGACAAMVGGCTQVGRLEAGDLLDEAARWQLGSRVAEAVIFDVIERIDAALDVAVRAVPAVDLALPEQVLRRLLRLRNGTATQARRRR